MFVQCCCTHVEATQIKRMRGEVKVLVFSFVFYFIFFVALLAQEYNERLAAPCDITNCFGNSFKISVFMCVANLFLFAFNILDMIYVIYRKKTGFPIVITNDEYSVRVAFTVLLVLNAMFACVAQILYFYYVTGFIVPFNVIWTLLFICAACTVCTIEIKDCRKIEEFCLLCNIEMSSKQQIFDQKSVTTVDPQWIMELTTINV
jgi:hypothetical protein